MIISDIHMHSAYSYDSESPMESMILGAIKKGLKTICFTEHLDFDYPSDNGEIIFQVDLDTYTKGLFELKEKYKEQIEVLYGIEMGLLPYLAEKYQHVAATHPFDFIIGSSHLMPAPWYMSDFEYKKKHGVFPENAKHGDPYEKAFWEGRSTEDIVNAYFHTIANNIKHYENFDTYAHMDYVIRYAPEKNKDYTYKKYADSLDEALKAIIDHDIALEVNTAGYKYGLGQPNPQSDILKRYRELGGEKITIGADGHQPEHIAYDFKKAEDLLTGLGFKYYTIFRKRIPEMIPF